MKKIYAFTLLCAGILFTACSKDNEGGIVKSVTINKDSYSLEINATVALSAIVEAVNVEDRSVTWSSSDASVATVDDQGFVTAKQIGTATITATSNAAPSQKGICEITVTDKPMVMFKEPTSTANEHDGVISIPFHLTVATDKDVTITFEQGIDDRQTAFINKHFQFPNEQNTVTLPAGTQNGEIKIKIMDNIFCDGNVYFDLAIRNITGGIIISQDSINKITIEDDDIELHFSKRDYEVNEGEDVLIEYSLSSPATFDVKVILYQETDKNIPADMYSLSNEDTQIIIPKGSTKGSFTLNAGHINDDFKDWKVAMSFEVANNIDLSLGYISYNNAKTTVTIKNIDEEPVIEPDVITGVGFASKEITGLRLGRNIVEVNCPAYDMDVLMYCRATNSNLSSYKVEDFVSISANATKCYVIVDIKSTPDNNSYIDLEIHKTVTDAGINNDLIDSNKNTCRIKY